MLRILLKQIWTERKINSWILLELIIITVIMWWIIAPLFVNYYNRSIPSGFDNTDIYRITLGEVPAASFNYNEEEDEDYIDNFYRIVERIKQYPDVEFLTIIVEGGYPYSGRYINGDFQQDSIYFNIREYYFIPGDYFKVFRYRPFYENNNRNLDDTELFENSIFITRDLEKTLFGKESSIGKTIIDESEYRERESILQVAGVIDYAKRYKSGQPYPICFYPVMKIERELLPEDIEIYIRTKEGVSEKKFIESFHKDNVGKLRAGNFFVKDITSGNRMEAESEYDNLVELRTQLGLGIFFLLNMMLGIIGTFWIRNESRRAEIGLRMAMGSTSNKIKNLFLSEGIILVSIATLIGLFILIQSVHILGMVYISDKTDLADNYLVNNTPLLFLIIWGLVYLLMVITACVGIWFPATVASKIQPAIALKDE